MQAMQRFPAKSGQFEVTRPTKTCVPCHQGYGGLPKSLLRGAATLPRAASEGSATGRLPDAEQTYGEMVWHVAGSTGGR